MQNLCGLQGHAQVRALQHLGFSVISVCESGEGAQLRRHVTPDRVRDAAQQLVWLACIVTCEPAYNMPRGVCRGDTTYFSPRGKRYKTISEAR